MTRCAQACFDWFRSPPEEGWPENEWSEWRTTAHAERAEPGGAGKRNREGVLECGAWLPEGAGPRPLVVVLHGCGQSPDEIDDELGWLKQAEMRRFAVLFIRETEEGRDNPVWWGPMIDRHCFDWFDIDGARKNEGQPAAIMRVIDKLTVERAEVVDRNRVFIVGFSAGAGMAGLLLTAWPDRLAGAGMIAGPTVGVAESLSGGWAIYVSPHMMFWPETMRRWAADLRADACRGRGVRPTGYRHKVSIWHGEVDTVVNRGHSVALVDQFAGLMEVPVTRQWSWFMPRLEISGQTAGHTRRTLVDPLGGGARRGLHRVTFTASGEAVIQANWIDYLGHAVPAAPAVGMNGEIIGENERRKYVGVDSTSEMLDFFGIAPPMAL